MFGRKDTKAFAKRFVENSFHDRETNTLFVTNPGISFETLKSLAKKHNFTVGKTKSGEYVSIPIEYKYSGQAKDISLYDDFLSSYTYYDGNYSTLLTAYKTFDLMQENQAEIDLILDTYVAEVLSQGFIEDPLKITISNKNAQALVEKVLYKNKFFQKLPSIVKSIAKYGNYGAILQYPYLEQAEANEDEEFKRIDVLSDLVISFVNPKNLRNSDSAGITKYIATTAYTMLSCAKFIAALTRTVYNNKCKGCINKLNTYSLNHISQACAVPVF